MHDATIYRRAAVLMALVAALAAIASSSAVHDALRTGLGMTDGLIAQHAVAGMVSFVALAGVSAMLAFVSIALAIPAAVSAWGTPGTAALLWLGWILGGIATYSVGRFLGRPVVRWLAAEAALRKVEALMPAEAQLAWIVLLQLALPSELPGYVLGLLGYPLVRYATALAIAELPYALATVYLGKSFIEGRGGLVLLIGVLLTLFSLAAFGRLHRTIKKRQLDHAQSTSDSLRASLH